jgi:hypothetical protein
VLVPNPCCESVTDALVERARRRSRHQRNAAALANAVHAVAALARTSPEVRAVPADDVASVADMMQQHAEVLRSAAGVAGATPTGGLRQEEGNA